MLSKIKLDGFICIGLIVVGLLAYWEVSKLPQSAGVWPKTVIIVLIALNAIFLMRRITGKE